MITIILEKTSLDTCNIPTKVIPHNFRNIKTLLDPTLPLIVDTD